MRQWLKKVLPNKSEIKDSPWLHGFTKYLQNPDLWKFDREPVARGVAIGLFAAFIPIFPLQTIAAILIAIWIGGNISIAFLFSWISNPFTILPITYLSFETGKLIFSEDGKSIKTIHILHGNVHQFLTSTLAWVTQNGKLFLVGVPIAAVGIALMGYIIVDISWGMSLYIKKLLHKKN